MKVNNISLKQEGGQNTEQVAAQPQQQSVDPAIQQISDFISQAISQGQNAAEVVMSLVEQQVDQQTIGQALMMNGFEENDIASLFEQMTQQQPEEQVDGQPLPIDELNKNPEELTDDTRMYADDMSSEETDEPDMSLAKSGIEIKPENEGNKDMNWQRAPLYINPMEFEYTNDNFSLGKAAAVAYGGYKEFLSGDDKNKDGVKDGFFRDGSKKSAIRDATKGDYYNYKITQDANDPNKYMADNTDLFNTSKGNGNLRTVDKYGKDVAANSRFNYDIASNDYNFITSSRPIDERIYNSDAQKNAIAGQDYNYLSDMDEDTKAMIMNTKDNPAGTRLGINSYGQASSYIPGADNPYEYDTYMGNNKLGVNQNAMIPTGNTGQPLPGMFKTPPMMSSMMDNKVTDNSQKSFKDWYATGDAVRNQGKNEEQLKSEYNAYLNNRFKYGGDLDKAQMGLPNWLAGLTNQSKPFEDPQAINDYFSNMGKTDYASDTQAVADAQLQNQNPGLGATPQQQQAYGMFNMTPPSNAPAPFEEPKVERTNNIEGGLNRLADSPGAQGYGKLSNFAVKGADVINDYFMDKKINQAAEDNFNKLGADYQYATAEDPFNKRGLWDINTGTAGSEGDRTTGLYMKYGGENNTIDVDSNLLAKLIAAGADIEIL